MFHRASLHIIGAVSDRREYPSAAQYGGRPPRRQTPVARACNARVVTSGSGALTVVNVDTTKK